MAEDPKIYPASSSELSQILNLESQQENPGVLTSQAPHPVDLPVFDDAGGGMDDAGGAMENKTMTQKPPVPTRNYDAELEERMKDNVGSAMSNMGKKVLPYIIVFALGLGLYYFYFSDFSFSSVLSTAQNEVTQIASVEKKDGALEGLKREEAANYEAWINQFFFDVRDKSTIDGDTDVSGNGLTNFQKYLLNLNPKIYDTRGDGVADGQAIIDGRNPWTGLAMTDEQKKVATTYFDNELISNRISAALANRSNSGNFSPYVSANSPFYQSGVSNPNNGTAIAGTQGVSQPGQTVNNNITVPVSNGQQVAGANTTNIQTAPTNAPAASPAARIAPATGVNTVSNNIGGNDLDIDTNIPGRVEAPALKISVPIIWTQNVKNFDDDLKKGVVHYPGTPLPGQVGTSYISGHSSGSLVNRSPYKQAFAALGNAKNGTSFSVTVTLKGGKQAKLHYVVEGRAEYAANDQRQFLQTSDSVVALSTCWPLNTTARRLVVFGRLTQIEK